MNVEWLRLAEINWNMKHILQSESNRKHVLVDIGVDLIEN